MRSKAEMTASDTLGGVRHAVMDWENAPSLLYMRQARPALSRPPWHVRAPPGTQILTAGTRRNARHPNDAFSHLCRGLASVMACLLDSDRQAPVPRCAMLSRLQSV